MKRTLLVVVLGAFVSAAPAQAQVLTRKPYLQNASPEAITIVWRTLGPSEGWVKFGESPAQLSIQVASPGSRTQHEVRLTGLKPDTRYYYQVGAGGSALAGGDAEHFFLTPPPVGTPKPFRMWVVGDSGTGKADQYAVRDAAMAVMNKRRADIYLHMGDMAYNDGTDLEFQLNFFRPYENLLRHMVVWPTLGNHEGHTSFSKTQTGPYFDAYVLPKNGEAGGLPSGTEAYYSFDYANVHFVVLDSHHSHRGPEGAMLRWMKADIAATRQEWLIAYWHHAPYTKGSHDSDTEGQLIDMHRYALPILEAAGVDLVLAGHSHIYERSYLVNGAYDTPTTAEGRILDSGDGRPEKPGDGLPGGSGAYVKPFGLAPHAGTVYVVAGHGGISLARKGTHPLMYFTEKENGSCFIDVEGDTLRLINVRKDGKISDHFTLQKPRRNRSPAFTAPAPMDVRVGHPIALALVASDPDGDAVTFSAPALPDGATLTPAGHFAWTPSSTQAGRHDVAFIASDGKGGADSTVLTVNVSAADLDAGLVDSGTEAPDASVADAGIDADAGVEPGGQDAGLSVRRRSSCASAFAPTGWLALLALAALRGRRRR